MSVERYCLVYVQMADFREAVVHGPFESHDAAVAYLSATWPDLTESVDDDVWESDDAGDVVAIRPLL